MARWTKNHMLELGAVLLVVGLVGSLIAFVYRYATITPGWLSWYGPIVRQPSGNWNTLLMIVAPIILVWGAFWVGEQVILRRRFERLLDTPKRSEFTSRRSALEQMTKRLPDGYRRRIKEKEGEFSAKRSA